MEVFTAASPPSADEFAAACLVPNRIGLVRGAAGDASWETPRRWVGGNPHRGDVDTAAFREFLGAIAETTASVVICDEAREVEDCVTMTVGEFLDSLEADRARTQHRGADTNATPPGLYLKDWHLQELLEGNQVAKGSSADADASPQPRPAVEDLRACGFYRVPDFLGADWLNAYVRRGGAGFGSGEDYRFVYLGTARTYTPFHTDVFGSYSWSLSLSGVKEWWFVAPNDMPALGLEPPPHWMKAARAGQPPLDPSCDYDVLQVPFGTKEVEVLRFVQRPGDMVFVPSGWGHQVWNTTPCLSVNHNWCNRHNVAQMTGVLVGEVAYLDRNLQDVKDLLEEQHADAGGYAGHCEWLMHNAQAWNVVTWTRMLMHWAEEGNADGDDLAVISKCLAQLRELPWGTGLVDEAVAVVRRR